MCACMLEEVIRFHYRRLGATMWLLNPWKSSPFNSWAISLAHQVIKYRVSLYRIRAMHQQPIVYSLNIYSKFSKLLAINTLSVTIHRCN